MRAAIVARKLIGGYMSNVKDIKSKEVKITLTDGVERRLLFDLNAMAELEDRYGSVDNAFEALQENSIKALRCVLWAGLIHDNPELTEHTVGSLIDIQWIESIVGTLSEAFDTSMPTEEAVAALSEGSAGPN